MRLHRREPIPVDVDSTLIFSPPLKGHKVIKITCPYTGDVVCTSPNKAMIRLVKEEHARGSHIFVWSRGGMPWAAAVVKALQLEKYVYDVFDKPRSYFDDKDVSEWLKDRVYIGPNERYKE